MKGRTTYCVLCLILAGASTDASGRAPSDLLAVANRHFSQKQFESAAQSFESAAALESSRSEATLGWARALIALGRPQEAAERLRAQAVLFPADANIRLALAESYLSLGQGAEAAAELARVWLLKPNQPGLVEKTGLAQFQAGNLEGAKSYLRNALNASDLSPEGGAVLLEIFLRQKDLRAVEVSFLALEKLGEPSAKMWRTRAEASAEAGGAYADAYFRRALGTGSQDASLWAAYGNFLLEKRSDARAAERAYSSGLALAPESEELLHGLARAQIRAGDQVEAARSLAKALAAHPGSNEIMYELLRLEEKRGDLGAAALALQAWIEKFPAKRWLARSYANILAALESGQRPAPTPVPVAPNQSLGFGEYTVRPGDVLGTISARVFGTSQRWREIVSANPEALSDPNRLEVGTRLLVPLRAGQAGRVVASADSLPPVSYIAPPEAEENSPAEVSAAGPSSPLGPWVFSAGLGPLAESVDVSGSGFGVHVPAKIGAGAALGAELSLADWPLSLGALVQFSQTKLSGFSGVSPGEIDLRRYRGGLRASYEPFRAAESWARGAGLIAGYDFRAKSATATAPRLLVSENSSSGFVVGASCRLQMPSSWRWESSLELYLPISFRENSASSGAFDSASGLEAATALLFPLSHRWEGKFGIHWRRERVSFLGSGLRGTVNATEKDWMIFLPFSMRLK